MLSAIMQSSSASGTYKKRPVLYQNAPYRLDAPEFTSSKISSFLITQNHETAPMTAPIGMM